MVRTKLGVFVVKTLELLWPGVLAAVVALSVVSIMEPDDVPMPHRQDDNKPCQQRACYMLLNERISNNEKALAATQTELNKRIDAMHREGR